MPRPADPLPPAPLSAARDADLPAIEAFLARHADSSMFLRSNLAEHGLGDRRSPRAMAVAVTREGATITGVFGASNAGYAVFQAPEAGPEVWAAFGRWLDGRPLSGLTGEATQLHALRAAMALDDTQLAHAHDEPLYRLPLTDLRLDALAPGQIRAPEPSDLELLEHWFTIYEGETLNTPAPRAAALGRRRAAQAILEGRMRLFEHDGQPLAMTAFNARLPDRVQVGGVFTPPEHRNRHAARSAVARHLAEARAEGVTHAILFASGPAASRAYEAIGFTRVGTYGLALLREPRLGGPDD